MPAVNKKCDVSQGYNFNRDSQSAVGHLLKLKIAEKQFEADQKVKSPIDEADIQVVAVLDSWYWEGGAADPFSMSGMFSEENKAELGTLLHTDLRNTEVLISFTVYEYYGKTKKYYKSVHTNDTDMKTLIEKSGSGDLAIFIADQTTKISGLELYHFSISVAPQREEQDLHIATTDTAKLVKKWGITMT